VCEFGEACTAEACDCASDCPPAVPVCPSATGPNQPCSGRGVCATGTGVCLCFLGYTGPACTDCDPRSLAAGGACLPAPGALVSCADGVRNGNEAGVDCGGPHCAPCPAATPDSPRQALPLPAIAGGAVLVAVAVAVAVVVVRWRRSRPGGVAPKDSDPGRSPRPSSTRKTLRTANVGAGGTSGACDALAFRVYNPVEPADPVAAAAAVKVRLRDVGAPVADTPAAAAQLAALTSAASAPAVVGRAAPGSAQHWDVVAGVRSPAPRPGTAASVDAVLPHRAAKGTRQSLRRLAAANSAAATVAAAAAPASATTVNATAVSAAAAAAAAAAAVVPAERAEGGRSPCVPAAEGTRRGDSRPGSPSLLTRALEVYFPRASAAVSPAPLLSPLSSTLEPSPLAEWVAASTSPMPLHPNVGAAPPLPSRSSSPGATPSRSRSPACPTAGSRAGPSPVPFAGGGDANPSVGSGEDAGACPSTPTPGQPADLGPLLVGPPAAVVHTLHPLPTAPRLAWVASGHDAPAPDLRSKADHESGDSGPAVQAACRAQVEGRNHGQLVVSTEPSVGPRSGDDGSQPDSGADVARLSPSSRGGALRVLASAASAVAASVAGLVAAAPPTAALDDASAGASRGATTGAAGAALPTAPRLPGAGLSPSTPQAFVVAEPEVCLDRVVVVPPATADAGPAAGGSCGAAAVADGRGLGAGPVATAPGESAGWTRATVAADVGPTSPEGRGAHSPGGALSGPGGSVALGDTLPLPHGRLPTRAPPPPPVTAAVGAGAAAPVSPVEGAAPFGRGASAGTGALPTFIAPLVPSSVAPAVDGVGSVGFLASLFGGRRRGGEPLGAVPGSSASPAPAAAVTGPAAPLASFRRSHGDVLFTVSNPMVRATASAPAPAPLPAPTGHLLYVPPGGFTAEPVAGSAEHWHYLTSAAARAARNSHRGPGSAVAAGSVAGPGAALPHRRAGPAAYYGPLATSWRAPGPLAAASATSSWPAVGQWSRPVGAAAAAFPRAASSASAGLGVGAAASARARNASGGADLEAM
jgi:hypothetical protein